MNPLLLTDYYKTEHYRMYPEGTTDIYSNMTPRKSRVKGVDSIVFFGMQYFIKRYLIEKFDREFFGGYKFKAVQTGEVQDEWGGEKGTPRKRPVYEMVQMSKEEILQEYARNIKTDLTHVEALWDLGYLPIRIKALEEGVECPIGVPPFTVRETHPDFAWLVNYLETLISCVLWQPITSTTLGYDFKKMLIDWAMKTVGNTAHVQWQGHDFSMRGMSSPETAIVSGMGHLISFTGTDTIPAIYALEKYYGATGLVGASVPATEHSVMCMGTKEDEIGTLRRLLQLYPTGILSVVMDTWDLTKVVKPASDGLLMQLKEEIMARDGKLVIRPDSSPDGRTPVDIICGHDQPLNDRELQAYYPEFYHKGLIQCLYEIFGGQENAMQYIEVDSHVGAIYGDSINMSNGDQICGRLADKRLASNNVVFGLGSFYYQYNTRDTFGFAIKATYGEVELTGYNGLSPEALEPGCWTEKREIFKDPITDDGTKKSKKGLLCVMQGKYGIFVKDQCTPEEEETGLLTTVFEDSKLVRHTTLDEIRAKLQ